VERSRSIGLRRALGSTRTGIVVWLVGEAAVWALLGAVLGLALAALMSRPVWEALAPVLPGYDGGAVLSSAIRLDTAAVSTLSALGAAVLFGIAPALAAARIEPAEAARET
jgi:putative ABC transport system permease protein